MALPSTLRRYEIAISDSDRGVYESVEWRVAQHPSETDRNVAARVIARCLEHAEGVELTRGLDATDEPALWQKNLRGELQAWIEVGSPSPERLHRASKRCERVVIYAYKQADRLLRDAVAFGAHRVETWSVVELDPDLLDAMAAHTDRVNRVDFAVAGGSLYLTINGELLESTLKVHTVATL
ncbi:MAG: YaeQ family protein [Sandaracinaceae bacterium]|nr:YaeQ family protein [Sandaracinaceae bacterium]